jgi:hypothetical protein
MPFSIPELLSSLNRYRSLISICLVSVWEVNFVLFNSMLKYVINGLMHAKALWPISISQDDNSPDMEKSMH